jgi:hypothetical protein
MVDEIKNDEVQNQTVEPTNAPEPDDSAAKLRQQLSIQGREYQRQLEEERAEKERLLEAERKREEATLRKAGEFETLEKKLKDDLAAKEQKIQEMELAGKRSKVESLLLENGLSDKFRRAGMMTEWDGETSAEEFAAKMMSEHAALFEPEKPGTRSAGSHPGVSTSSTDNNSKILELWNSSNNADVSKAEAMAAKAMQDGTLDIETAKALGIKMG